MSIDTFLLSADTTDLDYPEVRPTLDLNFARVKALDPRITFTRASGGSYVGADGLIKLAGVNEARFDHDPVTGESLGLLIEESRSNLITYSEQFDNAAWTQSGVTVNTNTTNSPNGTQTADKIIPSASLTGFKELQQNFSIISGTTYTFSHYLKSDGYRYVQIVGNAPIFGTFAINYDLNTGIETAFSAGTSTVVGRGIESIGNGWYRVYASVTALSTASGRIAVNIIPDSNSVRGFNWTGDGTSGVLFWGAQLEEGAFPTSYIPTVASTVTRSADIASITGRNFSEWYRPDEGTVYADTRVNGVQTARYDRLWSITNANLNLEGISLLVSGLAATAGRYVMSITVTNSGTELVDEGLSETAFTAPRLKSVFALKQNNCVGASNGQQRFVDSTVNLSLFTTPVDRLLIGQPQRFQGTSCMTISRLTYYPKRLTNQQLQALTR